jgi:xanthine dehydrogenase accessory factor
MLRIAVIGGGDVATGIAHRLFAAGLPPLVTELERPLVVRRTVSFAQAVLAGRFRVEGVEARRCEDLGEAEDCLRRRDAVPVLVDPTLAQLRAWRPHVVVDGRMAKAPAVLRRGEGAYVIGVGPGCSAGDDVDVVVESLRGHTLGHLIRSGPAAADTGEPELVRGIGSPRVLRATADGVFTTSRDIGQHVDAGEVVARVGGAEVRAEIGGCLRGLLNDGIAVSRGTKVGDIDPRDDPSYCYAISDRALAIGGAVLEAVCAFWLGTVAG